MRCTLPVPAFSSSPQLVRAPRCARALLAPGSRRRPVPAVYRRRRTAQQPPRGYSVVAARLGKIP